MHTNTDGTANTAVGKNALYNYEGTGTSNTAVGSSAGLHVTTGGHNTLLGLYAGASVNGITTGSQNTCVGANTSTNAANGVGLIVLGYNVAGQEDYHFTFGNGGSHRVYNAFNSNASWTRSSDERKKTNIADSTLGLDFINELRPVTFNWKDSRDTPKTFISYNADKNEMDTDITMHGMLAQDVKAALDKAGVDTFGGWAEEKDGSQSISQEMFVHPIIKAIQELSAEVKELKAKLKD
jgi:hypothetical protein